MIFCEFIKFEQTKILSFKVYKITFNDIVFTLDVVIHSSKKYKYLLYRGESSSLCHTAYTWREIKLYIINEMLHEK